MKGQNKSSLLYSDAESRKQTSIKANEQTVQVKKYYMPCILLIVYYLADYTIFDTDAWKDSWHLTVFCNEMLESFSALHCHYNTEFVREYLIPCFSLSFCLKKEKKLQLLFTLFSLITCPQSWSLHPESFPSALVFLALSLSQCCSERTKEMASMHRKLQQRQ